MKAPDGQPRLALLMVGSVVAVTALLISGCAVKYAHREVGAAPTMTAPVLALYNDGAVAFQAEQMRDAREKYQAALEKARVVGDEPGIGFSLAGLGAVHQALQEYPKALELFSAALRYFARTKNLSAEGMTLGAIGEVHAQLGDYANAIEAFDRGLVIAEEVLAKAAEQEKIGILRLRATVLFEKAWAHGKLEQFAEAVESYQRAAADFQMAGNPEGAGTALWTAGSVSRSKMKAPHQAIRLLAKAWSFLQEAGKVVDAAWARGELGWSYLEAGNYKEAAAVFAEVAKVATREGLHELAIEGDIGLGRALEGRGDFEEALVHYQAAVQRLRDGDRKDGPTLEAELLFLKGGIYRVLSRYEEAIEHFRAAAAKYREAQLAKGEAAALTRLAKVFFWLGDYKAANQHYEQALELFKAAGDLPKQVETLAALAEASWLGGEALPDEISGYLHEGKRLLDSVRTALGFDPVTLLAKPKEEMGKKFPTEIRRLAEKWRKEIPSLKQGDMIAAAYIEFVIAESEYTFQAWKEKVPSLGLDYLMAAGTLHQKSGTMSLGGGDPALAIEYLILAYAYHTSIPFNRDVGFEWAKDWFYLAEAYRRQGKFDLALLLFRRAKMMGILLGTPEIHWVYAGMARTYADMGNPVEAVRHYMKGLETLESIQSQQGTEEIKIGVLGGALYVYRGFVKLLLDVHTRTGDARYLHEAFKYNERLRARAFLDMLGRSRVTRLGGELGWLAAKEEEIRYQIARVHRQLRTPKRDKVEEARLLDRIETLRESWLALQRQAAEQSGRYEQIIFPRPVTVEEVQSILGEDAVLLEYSVGPERLTLWVITKDQVHAYTSPSEEVAPILEAFLKTVREPLMTSDEFSRHMALGHRLYRKLVGPAEEQIRGKKRLIIVPDGLLYYLPFEALIIGELRGSAKEAEALLKVGYLVKRFRVTYAPSASILVAQSKGGNVRKQTVRFPLVAFGDPIYREEVSKKGRNSRTGLVTDPVLRSLSLNPLEFSGEEVRRIARIWSIPLHSEHINLGDRATVDRVLELDLSRYRILHFATHGVLGDEVRWGSQPALVLSQGGSDADQGGLLQFADILNLKLNADLVVLSACNTRLGRLREGEGIVGLTRAFLYAGASAVVVSLWKVEDQSTSLLMERFYQRLKQGESKDEALRQAKLDVLNTTLDLKAIGMRQPLASPFYWAPFILVGEGP